MKTLDNTGLGYLITKMKAAFWPKSDVVTMTFADVATTGSYNDLLNKPTIPAAGIPSGGTTGQVLKKTSNTNYAVEWANAAESGLSVTKQKLATTTVPNVTSAGSASTWSFGLPNSSTHTLSIFGGNGTAPTLGTAITAATGSLTTAGSGADVVTEVTNN